MSKAATLEDAKRELNNIKTRRSETADCVRLLSEQLQARKDSNEDAALLLANLKAENGK